MATGNLDRTKDLADTCMSKYVVPVVNGWTGSDLIDLDDVTVSRKGLFDS